MKIHPDCVPCLLKRSLFEARLVDSQKESKVMEESLSILEEEYDDDVVSAEVATKVHGKVYEILENDDPYKEIKEKSNKTAEKLLPKAEKIADESFKKSVLVSIAGNVMDFGYRDDIKSPDYLMEEFQAIIDEGLAHDDTGKIETILKNKREIIFFTDNVGEIVFDKILLEKLKDYDIDLTVVVKGEPILTDATMEDAVKYGIDKIADDMETTEGYAVGVDFDLISENLKEKLEKADLIIAKGMANWESFSETEHRPIAFLTRSKCKPVSNTMGVPYEKNIAKLFE